MSEAVATTEVEVYQLHRGNHREEIDARAAEEIRHQIRCDERIEIDSREFGRLWELKGTETFEVENEGGILAGIWRRWNYSSGQESREFVEAKTRSMEVGDVVAFDGSHYLCLPIGWEEIEIGDEG